MLEPVADQDGRGSGFEDILQGIQLPVVEVSLILRSDVIKGHGSAEFFFIRNRNAVGIAAVFPVAD